MTVLDAVVDRDDEVVDGPQAGVESGRGGCRQCTTRSSMVDDASSIKPDHGDTERRGIERPPSPGDARRTASQVAVIRAESSSLRRVAVIIPSLLTSAKRERKA